MPVSRPNILWIVTTQWRASACGYAGDPNAHTPCLDALAAESVNYAQAVTPHPFGPFARAALLTGVPSPENGVRDFFDPLPLGARTIAHELRDRGCTTAFFGKWGVGQRDPRAPLVGETPAKIIVPPEGRGGFEFWEGFEGGFLLNDPWLHGSGMPEPVLLRGYQSDVVCDRAGEWVRSPAPWFCMVSLDAPHPPYDAGAAGMVPLDPGEVMLSANVPRGGEVETRARRELAGYYAHIAATDRAIGRLLESAPREDTLVVFTSVHGDMHGAHGLFRKGWPHEESVRVPLLIRGLRTGDRGRLDPGAISLLDLPKLMLARIENPAGPEPAEWGQSKIKNLSARISMPSVVALPHQCDRAWRGVRTPTRKLVLNSDGSPWLFFDLERDPTELVNLEADPARAAEIAALRVHA